MFMSKDLILILLLLILSSCNAERESDSVGVGEQSEKQNITKVSSKDNQEHLDLIPPPRLIPVFDPEVETRGISDMDELSREFLVGVVTRDGLRIKNLVVTEQFYLEVLWPEFEKSIHMSSSKGEFHWELLRMKSMGGMLEKFDSYGWEHLEYKGTFFDSVEYYDGFKLHNKPLVEVKDKLTGETRMLELFGSVVELDNGTLKILSIPG